MAAAVGIQGINNSSIEKLQYEQNDGGYGGYN